MKYLILIIFCSVSALSSSQTMIMRRTLTSNIKVPIPLGWQKVNDAVSNNIRTSGTYNIVSFYKKDILENTVTIYGDSVISKIILSVTDIQRLKEIFEKKTLPELEQISMSNIPVEKVLSILEKFYKNDPEKYKIVKKNKEEIISKANVKTKTPAFASLKSNGFYYLLPFTIYIGDISYSFSLISGYIKLNNYVYGISGYLEKANKHDFEQFIKLILSHNPS